MPVTLEERELRDALALLGEWDPGGGAGARSPLEWMGWEGEGPMELSLYELQIFLWSTLPRKFPAPLEDKRAAAAALAGLLDRLGDRTAAYAALCRAPETAEMLGAWEEREDRAAAVRRLRELMEASGLEPPDTDLLSWGNVMGFEEATARRAVALELEREVEAGRLEPGSRRFARSQAESTERALLAPPTEDSEETRIGLIRAERLERWVTRGEGFGSAERSAIVDPVASLVGGGNLAIDEGRAGDALAPTLWLLERAVDGVGLTQTGALNRAFVREAAERYPQWWDAELFGPPHRETDVSRLNELHELLRTMGLLRRRGKRVFATKRARELAADPAALLVTLATELLAGDGFWPACAEYAAALMLAGSPIDFSDDLAHRVQPVIAADGWQTGGEAPDVRDVGWAIAAFLRPAEAIGLIAEDREAQHGKRYSSRKLKLTEAGRPALVAALRARALAPYMGPH